MMLRLLLLITIVSLSLFAEQRLQSLYVYEDPDIKSTTLFPGLSRSFTLFKVPKGQYRYRMSTKRLVDRFAEHDIVLTTGRDRYVTFIRRSPIDLTSLGESVKTRYLKRYPSLKIHRLTLVPRHYTTTLPRSYRLSLRQKELRQAKGTFYIRFERNKKLYFDYALDAEMDVLHTKTTLDRKSEITPFNTTTRRIPFDRLRKEPLTSLDDKAYRLKHKMKADQVIGLRDVELTPVVRRAENVSVTMRSSGLFIEFSAVALEDGALHDIIAIRKHDGQRLDAKVTGPHRVEIE